MPRARHLVARHLALRERAAPVSAGVVNGVEGPLQVEESDLLPRDLDTLRRARSDVSGARDLDEFRHVNLLATSLVGTIGRWALKSSTPGGIGRLTGDPRVLLYDWRRRQSCSVSRKEAVRNRRFPEGRQKQR